MTPRIFLDIDGVCVDWLGGAAKLSNVVITEEHKTALIHNRLLSIQDLFKEPIYDNVAKAPPSFWEDLELFPWTHELIKICKNYKQTKLAFMSSYGEWEYGSIGKVRFVRKHFGNSIPLITTSKKHYCASKHTLLIDDYVCNIENFSKYGGKTFTWPCQYLLEDSRLANETLNRLDLSIQSWLENLE